jgi:hypothetical protein
MIFRFFRFLVIYFGKEKYLKKENLKKIHQMEKKNCQKNHLNPTSKKIKLGRMKIWNMYKWV